MVPVFGHKWQEEGRFYAEKTGITRTYAVRDRTTGRIVDTTGTFNSAVRHASKMNEKEASK